MKKTWLSRVLALRKSLSHRLMWTACLTLALVTSGCAERVAAAGERTATEVSVTTAQNAPVADAFAALPAITQATAKPAMTAEPPVQLTFEATETEPSSSWRPPLYEVPHALNANDHFYLISPLPFDYADLPVQDYRYGYVLPDTTTLHTGTDIKAELHTPIVAAADGKVVFAGYGLLNGGNDKDDPYGLAVVIRHNLSFQNRTILTVYAHMEKTTVEKGDWVKAGDQIGCVGMTGATSGPHVHFEIRLESSENEYETQNPELWIVPPVGYGVLAGRVMTTGGELLSQRQMWVKSLATGEIWTMFTYSMRMKRVDPYYRENLLLSSLPEGEYEVSLYYFGLQTKVIEVHPGAVTYFEFTGRNGFTIGEPSPASTDEFLTDI